MKCIINNIDNKSEFNPLTVITFSPDYYDILDYSNIKDIEDKVYKNIYKILHDYKMEKYNTVCDGIYTNTLYKIKTKRISKAVTDLYLEFSELKLKNFINEFYIIIGPLTNKIKNKIDDKLKKIKIEKKYYSSKEFKKKFKKTLKKDLS
jgi:hypothetical protein